MANIPKNPYVFSPIVLDQDTHEKRRIIKQLPVVHQTETLQKFFGATVDQLFDPGRGKSINGYVGQKPLWYDPDQDYYLDEGSAERSFYQLEASMVSKSEDGTLTDLLTYPGLINELRFQGGLVNNQNRLFAQDYYTWCPPIDLDKIINFRQYIWIPYDDNAPVLEIKGPTSTFTGNGATVVYSLPGYGTGDDENLKNYYDLGVIDSSLMLVLVDGVSKPFTYVNGNNFITFAEAPAVDSVVEISAYSDVENNAIGLPHVYAPAFDGVSLSSGMRIKLVLDRNYDFNSSNTFIVENVGTSIALAKEVNTGAGSTADYMLMARGAENQNEWSTQNRWFHVDTLSDEITDAYKDAHRGQRPIVEFNANLELFNYGLFRRLPVDLVVEDIEDINSMLRDNPTSINLGAANVSISGSGIYVDAINPETGTVYGNVESFRIMIRNTVNSLLNNNVFVLVNQSGDLTLILETDGESPSGTPVYGEVFKVLLGTYAGKNLNWNGSAWVASQSKNSVNQEPLFDLYDINNISLQDAGTYPNSNFKGNRLFNYQLDTSGNRAADSVLGVSLLYDDQGQIQFENYLATTTYQYIVAGESVDIEGFYFHKTVTGENESISNDWFKAPHQSRQFIVDNFVSDGRTKLFKISQIPLEIYVSRGRMDINKSFTRTDLVENKDYIRVDREIMIFDVAKGDIIDVRTFNTANPPEDMTGFYEIPLNLQANPNNEEISTITKGDYYEQFSDIMKNQVGFTGAPYSINNYRDTAKLPNLGSQIVQNSASLLKTMLLGANQPLDIMSAIRFTDNEYSRFKFKFQQKILSYEQNFTMANATSYEAWIDAALADLNKGKTKQFPFYLSGMAKTATSSIPTFIPPTPGFLGVYPLYLPQLVTQEVSEDDGGPATFYFIRGHDGSLYQADTEVTANVMLTLENRIYDSIPEAIRLRERPIVDFLGVYGDQFRNNEYSYDEWLKIMRPSFERWSVNTGLDYRPNEIYEKHDPWTWNWSSIPMANGDKVPGNWRGIYEKFYGTQRPDMTPWESLGFTIKPYWWDDRYGSAPYTCENLVLWDDIANGFIFDGDRKGTHPELSRPGISDFIPVDSLGRLRHPGPRWVTSDGGYLDPYWTDEQYNDYEYNADFVLGCGICPFPPLETDAKKDWDWGDIGPIEQSWRASSNYSFAVAQVSYLMKPAAFVEMGWNTADISVIEPGTINEQLINHDTMGRPGNSDLQVYGEVLDDSSLVYKVGVQQWISDFLESKNSSINTNLAEKVRGLGSQLSYRVAGFTDSSNLVVVSDSFGRVPSEDVTVSLYRSPSIKEEVYSGVAIEYTEWGYEIYGYNQLDPYFPTIPGNIYGPTIGVGESTSSVSVPTWRPNTYYSVSTIIKFNEKYYSCLKSFTSANYFEQAYWEETSKPAYADGARLTWYLKSPHVKEVVNVPYGTVLKTPQEVADFFNGYQRYLKDRGWVFEEVQDSTEVNDWKKALQSFIIWSNNKSRAYGDYITLSPCSSLAQFKSDHGTIQPIEQIVNGMYSIVDQNGQPIDYQITRVVRSDGDLTVSCPDTTLGIFGLRLYISEIEHTLVFNNTTIFNDIIYSPLLNIKQPRLRLQGFKTVDWKGRIDAPGFVVTGDTLTPNFERSVDDFRRFFDIEAMEDKKLQDYARANFGYEEKEYLNNLLLSPTNQFEFYQGMIQQKGSPTAMRRLLRSNFIRHNKGLQLFEEWAFRVGGYGGQAVQPSMDLVIRQSEYKHNPQLITFNQVQEGTELEETYGVIDINDVMDGTVITKYDDRWNWRPDMDSISWPVQELSVKDIIPSPGFVKLDEVRFTVPTYSAFEDFFYEQSQTTEPLVDRDRVWVYGIGSGDPQTSWMTYKFNFTGYNILNVFTPSFDGQCAVVSLDKDLKVGGTQGYYLNQINKVEKVIPLEVNNSDLLHRNTFIPRYSSNLTQELTSSTIKVLPLMTMLTEPHMVIDTISVTVNERFADGSTFTLGTENDPEYFIKLKDEPVREIFPTDYDNTTVLVETPDTAYVGATDNTADINLIRVGISTDVCGETVVQWVWVATDGTTASGTATFIRPSDYDPSQATDAVYIQTATVPITAGSTTTGTMTVTMDGVQTDSQTITIVPSNQSGMNFVDLTSEGTVYPFTYHVDVNNVNGQSIIAYLDTDADIGKMTISIDYHYTRGFELTRIVDGEVEPVSASNEGGTGQLYSWLETKFTPSTIPSPSEEIWDAGDIIEVTAPSINEPWKVYKHNGTAWELIRQQTRKIDSDLLTSAAIYNSLENKLKLILQLYDPAKGYIPGVADRELNYKTQTDPAVYEDGRLVWGKNQVHQLWWDQSAVRYLDYEIEDDLTSRSVNYRWKNWGRVAPGASVDIYQWVRSPVAPIDWEAYVDQYADIKMENKPTGTVPNPETANFVSTSEWNDELIAEEMIYYFWVLNPTVTPTIDWRRVTAQQVSSIIANPSANDIPFFAVIDTNKIIVGGINQYLTENDTVLKVKWTKDVDIVNNFHKEWILVREQDERNTIETPLWNKMRDSLVGWDNYVNPVTGLSDPKNVPDSRLPKPQQLGSSIRPRQSWFPADVSPDGGYRPSRAARSSFVDVFNNILSAQPYVDQWFDWQDVFETGEALPDSSRYVQTALDLEDLEFLLPLARQAVQPGECVLIENTAAANGFWTLWKLVEINGVRTFILDDFQKWRMQEGEMWDYADWYDDGWSVKNFPNYRFSTTADRDAAGNLDVTLLKGTLVQIDHTDGDGRWTWDVYTATTKYQVAKEKATIALNGAFYDNSRTEFGPKEVNAILSTPDAQRITPSRIQELADLIINRDGSRELEFLINKVGTSLFDSLQKNNLFFGMVKSAFSLSKVVDWAFKTSFLYIGGYSETLRQSPVAFKDQIDNVIAYLEEVKPYHVKIREYVRRLSYGPDVADLHMTDFDKPVYPMGNTNVVLNPDNVNDQLILSNNRPWVDWYDNYQKPVEQLADWDSEWNGVRKLITTIKYDRISCGTVRGWDTSPWDPPIMIYSQVSGQTHSLSSLSALYRSNVTPGGANPYNDSTVDTIDDRNALVRDGIVTTSLSGTIVTVKYPLKHFMWTGADWIEFQAIGWDQDPDQGTATRIEDSYAPLAGMKRLDDPGLIDGCDFTGTVVESYFQDGVWDIFEWDSTGYSEEYRERVGYDIDMIDGTTTPAIEDEPGNILMDGKSLALPANESDRPKELANFLNRDSIVFTVTQNNDGRTLKAYRNQLSGMEMFWATTTSSIGFVEWSSEDRTMVLNVASRAEDSNGYTLIHDPENPSTGFVRDVALSTSYQAKTASSQAITSSMTFSLPDLDNIPAGLVGDEKNGRTAVRVAIQNPSDTSKFVMASVSPFTVDANGELVWSGSFTVTVDSVVDLGTSKSWNIIPMDLYNDTGVVWVGNARIAYTSIEWSGNTATLKNVRLTGSSLQPVEGTNIPFPTDRKIGDVTKINSDIIGDAVSLVFDGTGLDLVDTTYVYDGSKNRMVS